MDDRKYDYLERRCPRLGGAVPFAYCRTATESDPCCYKILDCWWEQFDVVAHMRQCLSEADFEHLVQPPTPNKAAGLLQLIEQARRRMNPDHE